LACWAGAAAAQEPSGQPGETQLRDGVTVVIEGEARPKTRLALPAAKYRTVFPPAARQAAEELEQTLRNDLELNGIFSIMGPEQLSGLEVTGEFDHDFELYRSLGNEVVLLSELILEGDKIVLEGRIFDLKGQGLILGKRYRGTFDLARRMAHTFNDEIVFYFTGQRGIGLTSIAFTSDRDGVGIKELYVMDYDGYDQRRITGHESLTFTPAWSPDGKGLAYTSYYELSPSIYWADRETGRKSGVFVDEVQSTSPDVSPDGGSVVFSRSLRGNIELFRCRIFNCQPTLQRLTDSGAIDTNPSWSADGRQIAFTSSRSGSPQIYVMNADGGNVRRLTLEGRYNEGADWSPDGRRIVFAHRTANGARFDIAQVEVETGDMKILTSGPGTHEAPSFSPDGNFIAYESTVSGSKQIHLMTADGQPVRQLTSIGRNYGPSWSGYLE
jgi:TolB protein